MLKSLIEKRNQLLTDARNKMNAGEPTAEVRAAVDKMLADAQILKGDIERYEASAETEERSLPKQQTPPRGDVVSYGDEGKDERTFEQRNRDTNIALRKYLKGHSYEERNLTQTNLGGVMIPVAAVQPVQAQRSAGSIYDIVRHLKTGTGEAVKVPFWDDTANGFVLESAVISTNDPSIVGTTIQVDGLRSNPILIDNKLIADLDYDLVTEVNKAIQARYYRSASQFIVQGNTSNFVALSAPSALTTSAAGKIGYNDLSALVTALDPAYAAGAAFSFSNATLGAIMQIADANNRPLFLPFNDGGISGFAGTMFGYPVKIDQYAPTITSGNQPVRFGDHAAAYCMREVAPGVVIKQSVDRWVELNALGVVAFARAGGAPTIASTQYPSLISLTVK